MFDNLLNNFLENAKNQINNQKKLLDDKVIDFFSSDKKIKIKINLNYKIIDIDISEDILSEGKEAIEDLLVVNLNKAIEAAEAERDKYLENMKKDLMPDINDIFNSFSDDAEDNTENDANNE